MNKKEILKLVESIELFFNNPFTKRAQDKTETLEQTPSAFVRMDVGMQSMRLSALST